MKRLTILNLLLAVTLILGSCSTSNTVVNNRLISKRKYNKGFHINKKGHFKSNKEDVAIEEDKGNETYALEENVQSNVQDQSEERMINESTVNERTSDVEGTSSVNAPADSDVVVEERKSEKEEVQVEEAEAPTSKKDVKKAVKNQKKKNKRKGSSSGGDAMFILAVIFAILIPPLGVGIYTNIDWMKVLICLLLTFLFFLPGMIYALLVVFDII